MALSKRTYTAGVTKITADNLNAIQDAIISQEERKPTKQEVTDALGYTPPKSSDIPSDAISANTLARHSHSNKEILDKITGIVDADSVTSPGNQTDLVDYSGFQTGSQLLLQQVEQQYLKKTDAPTALKNPKQLKFTGAVTATYDGSNEVTVEIPSGGSGSGGSGQDGKPINWCGEYNGNTTYAKLDAVSYEGSAYVAKSPAIGAIPGIDEDVWDLMAEKGEDGNPGIVISSTQPTGDMHPVWLNPAGGPSGDLQPSIWSMAGRSASQASAYSAAGTGREFEVDKYYHLYSYSGTTQSPSNGTVTELVAGVDTLEFKVNAVGATASQLSGYGVVVPLELETGKSYIFGAKCASSNSSVYLLTYTLSDAVWTYASNSRICYSTTEYCSFILAPDEGKSYAICFAQKTAGVGAKNVFSQISLRENRVGVPLLQIWDQSSSKYAAIAALKGPKGDKGDAPVKGTDYWTAADKSEMVSAVLAALPDGTEVAY